VRDAFFAIPSKPPGTPFEVLITGGSRGARTLNRAASELWHLLAKSDLRVRTVLQCGRSEKDELERALDSSGADGEVAAFIDDMPAAYAEADLIISRSGAGAVSEIAAAGKPSILVPFPFAADDHQRHNAEAMARNAAAIVIPDAELTGRRLFEEIGHLAGAPELLIQMGESARAQARPGAAQRAASILEAVANRVDTVPESPEQ